MLVIIFINTLRLKNERPYTYFGWIDELDTSSSMGCLRLPSNVSAVVCQRPFYGGEKLTIALSGGH